MSTKTQKERLQEAGKQIAGCLLESLTAGIIHAVSALTKEVGQSLVKAADGFNNSETKAIEEDKSA